ncbi:MAG: 60S ribosomal subunit assembly/export protein [Sarea resinae]|nr:MAG: 60S ribosomal subunit assembly/export protein [Sarea resinae]
MAPTKPSSKSSFKSGNKSSSSSTKGGRISKSSSSGSKSSSHSSSSKSKGPPRPPPKQQKTKPSHPGALSKNGKQKKKKVYTAEELGVPVLNAITPVGVTVPKGKKKGGKVFVDDRESMMTILAMVNAEKEGEVESKMMRARQLEEIREARKKEAEKRQDVKRSKLEETKESIRKQRKRRSGHGGADDVDGDSGAKESTPKSAKKKVAFA